MLVVVSYPHCYVPKLIRTDTISITFEFVFKTCVKNGVMPAIVSLRLF